ncbi:DegT/DnrJ/EryC1/StrS family aminotransferase [Bacteriovorax sp. DB6_IX]|uniref:DegT/DnrJ/EryC1/StrS family aminotransferase n=1 Tax=Bacteriovorax sp. DB6_IX TaxID=1353530 RepID=UPI00038A41B2|nr:DegT/DnrJ/EryC1/StrS family aminotransferase [Bacteriovorax sp. DB6_IX]EQC49943.1 DegT/DnrJ/EryC1/StrS aminotransferase domain protein [Bacteriovorax sp. DB6_IX]
MLPRFKYFVSIRELLTDLFKLVQSDMSEDKLVGRFEAEMSKIFCRDYVTTVSSYRMGVYYYLKSLNLEKGSEVLLTPITIPDLINVILLLELKPVFVDMDEETHSICINDLIKKYNDKSKVLILTYLSGIVSKSDELISFTQEKDLKVIEDISQAYGSKLGNGDDPYFGDIQVGSLSSGKIISTYTGGVVLSHEEETIQRIISLKENEQLDPPKKRFLL